MASKNSIKKYISNRYYHLYARGINKRSIFTTRNDYLYFVKLLEIYLTPNYVRYRTINKQKVPVPVNTVCGKIEVVSYCLMTNHFHLLCKNIDKRGIQYLMQRVLPSYSSYYNRKYDRIGSLIQRPYRAVLIETEAQLIITSNYIHSNPVKDDIVKTELNYEHSSYKYYIEGKSPRWFTIDDQIKEVLFVEDLL